MSLLKNTAAHSLLLTIIATALIIGSSGAGLYPRVFVDMWNRMPQGTELTVHCKSKDNDLGIQSAGTGVAISFNFVPNVVLSTLFDCVANSKFGVAKFNVYQSNRDSDRRCVTQCTWNFRADGVHGVNQDGGSEDLFFPWGR